MKKVMLGLVMVMMLMSLVGCGETKKEGFVPDQVTETPNNIKNEEIKEEIENVANGDLTKYYDVKEYVGTPYYVKGGVKILKCDTDKNTMSYRDCETDKEYCTEYVTGLWDMQKCDCVKVDNNTPNDTSDDVIVYIFTTPIQ